MRPSSDHVVQLGTEGTDCELARCYMHQHPSTIEGIRPCFATLWCHPVDTGTKCMRGTSALMDTSTMQLTCKAESVKATGCQAPAAVLEQAVGSTVACMCCSARPALAAGHGRWRPGFVTGLCHQWWPAVPALLPPLGPLQRKELAVRTKL